MGPEWSPRDLTVLEKTFQRLQRLYERERLDPGKLDTIGLKPGWTVVNGRNGLCGTAFRFTGPHKVYEGNEADPEAMKRFVGKGLMEVVAESLHSSLIPLRSLAVASLSALSQPLLTPEALMKRGISVWEGPDYVEAAIGPNDIVTLIGYGGMVQNVLGRCRELHVADMRPPETLLTTIIGETVRFEPSQVKLHGAEDDEALLGGSDVVIITASSLVNGTIDELLRYAARARSVGLYGPSASVIPDVLFEEGADFVLSHRVQDRERFIEALMNDMNMESALRKYQRYQTMLPVKPKTRESVRQGGPV
ncbi:MAG: DUF364 domain-containing protein [Syntrophorhabdales bacterium]